MKIPQPFVIAILVLAICSFSSSSIKSQWTYGSPFSVSPPSASWHQVDSKVPVSGNIMLQGLTKPYPTNEWFNVFFLYGTTFPYPGGQGELAQNRSWVYPYQIGFGKEYSTPNPSYNKFSLLGFGYRPFIIDQRDQTFPKVYWDQSAWAFLGQHDPNMNIQPSLKNDYTELSATIRYANAANSSQYYEAPLVRGMPYVTMIYNNVQPEVFFWSPALESVNDIPLSGTNNRFQGKVFKLKTSNTPNPTFPSQTWMLYCSDTITIQWDQLHSSMYAVRNLTGYFRMAELTYQSENLSPSEIQAKITLLNKYAKFVPLKGEVAAIVTGNTSNLQYRYTRYNENASFGDSLLMLALPHHVDILPAGSTTNILKFKVLKGTMNEVYKNTWNMTEQLADYSWYPKNGNLSTVPEVECDSLKTFLLKDTTAYANRNYQWTDVYASGKSLAKLGRLAVISDELIEKDASRYASLVPVSKNIRDSLKIFLGKWLNGQSTILPGIPTEKKDSIIYDRVYGGLISSRSHDSLNLNSGVDFGSAVYNDHHFHYGYYIYAAATIAKKDPAWFTANNNYYLNRTIDLIREIANPSRNDKYFALHRYKDWFDGNSWANGMVPYGGGKNQESSTESINAWYGMYLFGLAMNNADIMNTGRIMLAQEIRSTQKYYHINIPQTNPVYLPVYTNKFHTVTNLYQGTMDASTFFGDVNYYSTGIQIIPITPVTEQLWGKNISQDIFNYSPNGLKFTPCFDPGNTNQIAWQWTSICVGVQAIAYPEDALDFFKHYKDDLNKLDNGQSHSNVYHWIITRNHRVSDPPLPAVIKLAQEGFYNPVTNKLNIRDTVSVYLRNALSPFNLVDSARSVIDSVDFSGSFLFSNAPVGTYYLQIKHRNSMETWSRAGGESFTPEAAFSYDFSSASSQAFGNNMVLADSTPVMHAIYSGDIIQDGNIDLTDVIKVYNDAVAYSTGYNISDLNGDYQTDLSDVIIVLNNSNNFVNRISP
ncbi:MAG TPA: glycosyl hydrolase [Ignavibacteria bacterium]|nr:glycosyl hydrolase [Ignavibacteria bacterium]